MPVYNNVQYASRDQALQAIDADEARARAILKTSRMHYVASITLTLVLSILFASDVLGFTQSNLQTKVLTVFGLGFFLVEDRQRARELVFREAAINLHFLAARNQLGS